MNTIRFAVPEDFTVTTRRSSMTLEYFIKTDKAQTPATLMKLPGVPKVGDRCPLLPALTAQNCRANMIDAHTFIMKVQFQTPSSSSSRSSADDPWDQPPRIRYRDDPRTAVTEVAFEDADSIAARLPILNSAGDPFDTPPQILKMRRRIEMTWYRRHFDDTVCDDIWNTVNRNAVFFDGRRYEAETLWCISLGSGNAISASGKEYYRIDCVFLYDREGFHYRPLQCGYRAIDPSDRVAKPVYVDDDGKYTFQSSGRRPVNDPVLLNSIGELQRIRGNAEYGDFRCIRCADWSKLNLPKFKAVSARED